MRKTYTLIRVLVFLWLFLRMIVVVDVNSGKVVKCEKGYERR